MDPKHRQQLEQLRDELQFYSDTKSLLVATLIEALLDLFDKYDRAEAEARYSDEERQVLELVRLMREADVGFRVARIFGTNGIKILLSTEPEYNWLTVYGATTKLKELLHLAPKPPQPTKSDADRLIKRIEKYMRESIARGDGHAIGLKIDVDDYLKRNEEVGGDDER